jgi:L-ascorbate metabolism protein UlaG (beta-lactamase superfamily)
VTVLLAVPIWLAMCDRLCADNAPQFTSVQIATNGEATVSASFPAGQSWRIDVSSNLVEWEGLATYNLTAPSLQHVDSAAPFSPARSYRGRLVPGTNVLSGDHLQTSLGELTIHPINHATFVIEWNGRWIYSDPVGGAARFAGLPRADLILVTHSHNDHFDTPTLNSVKGSNTVILAPAAVYQALGTLKAITAVLTNGSKTNWMDLQIEAIPAYNLTSSYHPKGTGNGYILTFGDKRVFLSGDTEDIPEVHALENIDVAFLCMNLPFTMSVDKAAALVGAFKPRVIYPYHYSGSDVNRFKKLIGTGQGIEVRLRKWY